MSQTYIVPSDLKPGDVLTVETERLETFFLYFIKPLVESLDERPCCHVQATGTGALTDGPKPFIVEGNPCQVLPQGQEVCFDVDDGCTYKVFCAGCHLSVWNADDEVFNSSTVTCVRLNGQVISGIPREVAADNLQRSKRLLALGDVAFLMGVIGAFAETSTAQAVWAVALMAASAALAGFAYRNVRRLRWAKSA
jgi:hypothetical protein